MPSARVMKMKAVQVVRRRVGESKKGAVIKPKLKATAGRVNKQQASAAPKGRAAVVAQVPPPLKGINAVVVNLVDRPDRWHKMKKSVGKQAEWLHMDRLDAVDGRKEKIAVSDVTKKWSTARLASLFPWYRAVTCTMSPGERGCCGSHIKAWRIAANQRRPLLVLEDDAVAMPTFTPTLATAVAEAPKGTEMIFLSSKDRGYPKKAGEVLMEPSFVWTTVGYLIWPAAARKLLGMLPLDMPVDNFLAWHIKQGAIKAFTVKPAAVRQAQTWNVGSDVPHSDDIAYW